MRILQWAFPFISTRGGRENFILNLADDLTALGDEVHILGLNPELDQPAISATTFGGREVLQLGIGALSTGRPGVLGELSKALFDQLDALRPEVIHAHNPEGPDLLLLRAVATKLGIPVVLTIHGPLQTLGPAGQTRLKLVTDLAAYVVGISEFSMHETLRNYPALESKMRLVVNGVPGATGSSAALASSTQTVFASGRLSPEKGFAQLLAAFALLRQVLPAARLVIAGDGPDGTILRRYAEVLGVAEGVHFLGWLDQSGLQHQLAEASVVAVPSVWQEPFGLVAVEAMQASLPVVASNRGALPEIVVAGETGMLFESGDVVDLASKLRHLLENSALARKFGQAGRERAARLFGQRRCTLEYRSLYLNATGKPTHFSVAELAGIGAAGEWRVYPHDLGMLLHTKANLPAAIAFANQPGDLKVLKLTHDDTTPLPPEITDRAVVFRTSMLATSSYQNEYPLPTLIAGKEFADWPALSKSERPTVGFVGQAESSLYHRAISQRDQGDVAKIGYQNIAAAEADQAVLRTPVNIGLLLRKRALAVLDANPELQTDFVLRDSYHHQGEHVESAEDRRQQYLDGMRTNAYSLCIRGAGNYSIRLYETMAAGRIPIILNTGLVLPLDGVLPWREVGVWVEAEDLGQIDQKVLEFHAQISPAEFIERQRANRELWLRYLTPTNFWLEALSRLPKGDVNG